MVKGSFSWFGLKGRFSWFGLVVWWSRVVSAGLDWWFGGQE